jgi:hypothetical protein
MGIPTSEVGYTSATAGRGDHEVHKGHVVALATENLSHRHILFIHVIYIISITAIVKPRGIARALIFHIYWILIDEIIHGWPTGGFLEPETYSFTLISIWDAPCCGDRDPLTTVCGNS